MKSLKFFLIVLILGFPFVVFGIWAPHLYTIKGPSMEPNVCEGDKAIVLERGYNIKRFDIVIIRGDDKDSTSYLPKHNMIKRVIGLPGELLEYENGVLLINRKVVDESFLKSKFHDTIRCHIAARGWTPISAQESISVPDYYYVLGDNRTDSFDSRTFGPIKREYIIGKLLFKM